MGTFVTPPPRPPAFIILIIKGKNIQMIISKLVTGNRPLC